ncbi:hypothetical protein KCU81_g1062, partial [Aureobasidium melanogenum]|uniref:Uncharacterized protein n=1 Tax=Aureobasidium melanogenum (strain CBS 110374) TaxID=1043003 RepID=A0A074W1R1_AURM1
MLLAIHQCIRLLEPQLSPCSNLDWLIYGQPVIALFSRSGNSTYTAFDREHLGQPSRHTRGQSLKLWVACDDANRLLVILTQEIQVSSGKKPRIFYLCISVESLAVDTACPTYWAISDGVVPLKPLDQSNDADTRPEQTSRLLRISFSPAAKSYVIMPDFPHTGRVSEASMSLLRKLKALSQAPYFDLFTTHDSWIYQSLLRLQVILSGRTVTGFNISCNNFYPGGRRAIIDAWESQGWRPLVEGIGDESEIEPECRKGLKRKHDAISTIDIPAIGSPAPPPYDLPVSDLPSAATPGAISEAGLGAASTASFDMAAVLVKECAESGRASVLSEVYPRGRSISLPPETTFKPLSPNFDFTPIARSIVPAVTPEPTTPVCIAAVSSPCRSVALSIQMDDYSPAAPASAATPPQAPPHYVCKSPLMHVPETPPFDTLPTCKAIAASTNTRSVLVNWLATLLRRYPYFHHTCIAELLALALAVRRGDAEDTIRRLRARCLASLLDQVTDYNNLEVEHKSTNKIGSSELEELVSWLLLLNPDGDLVFLEQLSEASRVLKNVRDSEHIRGLAATPRSSDGALFDRSTPKDEYASVNEFMICKASIILNACMAFGDDISGQTKHDIKDRMLEEMERLIR